MHSLLKFDRFVKQTDGIVVPTAETVMIVVSIPLSHVPGTYIDRFVKQTDGIVVPTAETVMIVVSIPLSHVPGTYIDVLLIKLTES